METVGDLIRQGLKDAGRLQASVCRASGISQKHLSQVLLGKARLSVDIAVRLEIEVPTLSAEALLIAQVRQDIAAYENKGGQHGNSTEAGHHL